MHFDVSTQNRLNKPDLYMYPDISASYHSLDCELPHDF